MFQFFSGCWAARLSRYVRRRERTSRRQRRTFQDWATSVIPAFNVDRCFVWQSCIEKKCSFLRTYSCVIVIKKYTVLYRAYLFALCIVFAYFVVKLFFCCVPNCRPTCHLDAVSSSASDTMVYSSLPNGPVWYRRHWCSLFVPFRCRHSLQIMPSLSDASTFSFCVWSCWRHC